MRIARRPAPRRAPASSAGVSASANRAGVALLTPTSVACADSTTATSRVNGLMNSSSVCGIGRVAGEPAVEFRGLAFREGRIAASLEADAAGSTNRAGAKRRGFARSSAHPIFAAHERGLVAEPVVFRARAAAASQPAAARFSHADAAARAGQPGRRHRLCRDRRLAGLRVFRPRRRARSISPSASVIAAPGRARRCGSPTTSSRSSGSTSTASAALWQFQPFWLRVVLEERPDQSNRLLAGVARQEPRHRRFSPAADAPRTGRRSARGAGRWRTALNPANNAG